MKKALVIGINYIGTSNELHGCINDALNMKEYLKTKGFKDEDIVVMTDHSENQLKPIAANLIREMKNLISHKNSELFLSYSGHGASIRDRSGDERDGKDETIVPLDLNLIIDDDLRKILVEPLDSNSKLTVIFDCCHSGSGLDLRYNYVYHSSLNKKTKRFVVDIDKHYAESKGQVVLLSGCEDPDYSADAYINNQAQGAMTAAFLSTIRTFTSISYSDLLIELRKFMKKGGYAQVPQLSSGKSLNLDNNFEF